ncbi:MULTISPECIES: hypothetical protein [unclassified Blastococcus]
MSRKTRLLLAPAAALALLAVSPGTASAEPATPDPLGALRDLSDTLTGGFPELPTPPAPAPSGTTGGTEPGTALPEALQEAGEALPGAIPGAGGDPAPGSGSGAGASGEQTPAETAGDPGADEPAPNPVAGLCGQLRDGLGALDPQLAAGIDQLCEAAEADPTAAIQDLLEQLLAALPTSLEEGCDSLIGLIEQGGAALGVDPAPLVGLVEQLCALIPGPAPEQPRPEQPQHPQPAHPVVHPEQQPQPAVVPVSSGGPTGGGGQLAYTGLDPKPYLFGGVAALGLGAGLQLLGRRRQA